MHRPLLAGTYLTSAAAVLFLALVFLDDRELDGYPLWVKPLKFAVSFAIFFYTWAWMLSLRHRAGRTSWWMGTALAVSGVAEIGLIAFQAARAHRSHFNESTPQDAAIWRLMGLTIAVLLVAQIVAAAALLLERQADRPATWAVRLGLIVSTLGIASGALMAFPRPGQNLPDNVAGAHAVGVPDGGAGLPFVGWSTTGGDLRVPHFIGMHGLQLLPLLAIALAALAARVAILRHEQVRARLVLVAGLAYLGLFALVTWQALRAQPLLSPDGLTLGVAGVLLMLTLGGVVSSLARPGAPIPQNK
ncbi:hypothetical protein [Nonomuraea sp. NPDC050310]|uniref:hypothetical protein n=1 Tax=unclassified Nonomuraea TaxID=2593643 RepID=UPI0033FF26F6